MASLLARLREEFSFIRGNLLVLIAGYTITRSAAEIQYPFRSLYVRELGASPFLIGLIASLGSAIFALVRIPGAYVADAYGRKRVVALFTYLRGVSLLFYVFAPDWRCILAGEVVANLFGVYFPALEAIEADSMPPERRGTGYAATSVLPSLAAVFAAPIGGILVERMDLVPAMRVIYGVNFAAVMVVGVLRTLFLRETLHAPEGPETKKRDFSIRGFVGSFVEAWSLMPRDFLFLSVALLITAFNAPLFQIYMALYANDVVGVSGLRWSLTDTAFLATTLAVGIPLGKVTDKFGRKRSLLLGYLFSTPVIAFFIFSRGFLQLLVVYILFAVGQALILPAFLALRADLIPKDKRGRVMGVLGTLRVLATIPSAAIFGYLYQVDRAVPFCLAIALEVLIVLIIIFFVGEPKVREA